MAINIEAHKLVNVHSETGKYSSLVGHLNDTTPLWFRDSPGRGAERLEEPEWWMTTRKWFSRQQGSCIHDSTIVTEIEAKSNKIPASRRVMGALPFTGVLCTTEHD